MADRSPEEMYADWVGHDAYDPDGNKLGAIQDIYFDDESDRPSWITVNTGLFGRKVNFVPLEGSRTTESGEDLVVAYGESQVKDAPKVDADGSLSASEERELYAHYGRPHDGGAEREPRERGRVGAVAERGPEGEGAEREREPERPAGAPGGEAGTQAGGVPAGGGLRLRKYTVTEERTIKVPVTREEVRLERDPDAGPEGGPEGGSDPAT